MSASPVFSAAALGRHFIFSPPSSPRSIGEKAARKTAEILAHVGAISRLAAVVPASRLDGRPAPEMVSSGIPQLDSLTGGFARGCLTEICGTASSGRTSVLLFALARATQRGEVCALVDASDVFNPASAAAAGMEMSRLLWVRCGDSRKPPAAASASRGKKGGGPSQRMSASGSYQGMPATDAYQGMQASDLYRILPSGDSYQILPSGIPQGFREGHDFSRAANRAQSSPALAAAGSRGLQRGNLSRWINPEHQGWESQLGQMLKVTDLLLQSNGFGMIALDLGDVPPQSARRIPLASWFRFRRAIERTPTALLVLEQQPIAGSCSSVLVKVSARRPKVAGEELSAVSCQLSVNQLPHSELLDQFEITAELLRSRLERKPVQSTTSFKSRAAWAG